MPILIDPKAIMDKKADLAELAGEFFVREMQPEDIPAVMDIDRDAFPNPWPENTYRYELRKNPAAHLFGDPNPGTAQGGRRGRVSG